MIRMPRFVHQSFVIMNCTVCYLGRYRKIALQYVLVLDVEDLENIL